MEVTGIKRVVVKILVIETMTLSGCVITCIYQYYKNKTKQNSFIYCQTLLMFSTFPTHPKSASPQHWTISKNKLKHCLAQI